MKYIERTYRKTFSKHRFRYFRIINNETDMFIGVDHQSYNSDIKEFCKIIVNDLRNEVDEYIKTNPEFLSSLKPLTVSQEHPDFAFIMNNAGTKAGVGPMASVAGYFAEYVAESLINNFNINELVIENGGDIYVKIKEVLSISVFAGESVLSGKTCIDLPSGKYGICTSAGTIGHSYSFGNSDATVIVSKDIVFADAMATAVGNIVKKSSDMEKALNFCKNNYDILSCLIIIGENIGFCGEIEPYWN